MYHVCASGKPHHRDATEDASLPVRNAARRSIKEYYYSGHQRVPAYTENRSMQVLVHTHTYEHVAASGYQPRVAVRRNKKSMVLPGPW
jgi:hypothetical protein